MIRSKKRVARRKRLRKEGRLYDLPSNVSVKQLQPFPQYPPDQWVGDLDTSVKVFCSFVPCESKKKAISHINRKFHI